ncbi:PQQ-binding-like beta-propeller repeat protein [Halorubrum sp. F4]|uniref:outer membrane protein assembly factor BamB family protein n=1 Tax=Halorubrum sp. F4 TaxID=2989715 RepID=UPI002480AA58|nr:PQQ-binding-like beta-propeller repeat protein [Halorubrum sp. F4]
MSSRREIINYMGAGAIGAAVGFYAGARELLGIQSDETVRQVPEDSSTEDPSAGDTSTEESSTEDASLEGVWPQAGYDAQSRSANPAGIPQRSEPSEQWVFETGWEVRGEPAVSGEELYFTSLDGNLYNVDATTGEEGWRYETSETGWTSPALWDDLVLFTSARDDALYAIDADSGSLSWEFETRDSIWRSPKVVEDTVYFGSNDQNLYAVDIESGTEQWRHSTDGAILSVPAVADDRVYFTSRDDNLYCVDQEDGSELWSVQASDQTDPLIGSPTVVGETVVQSARGGPQRGYSTRDGTVLWETDVNGGGGSVHDGILYYTVNGQDGSTLRAVDPPTEEVQWTLDQAAAGNITDDVLYYTGENGAFGAVDLESQNKIWESTLSADIKGSPLVVDEWVYLPGGDNNLYAYK